MMRNINKVFEDYLYRQEIKLYKKLKLPISPPILIIQE